MTQKTPRKLVPRCLSRILSHLFSRYPVNLLICLIMSPFHELTLSHTFMPFHAVPPEEPLTFLILCICDLSLKTQVRFYFLGLFLQMGFSFSIHVFYVHSQVLSSHHHILHCTLSSSKA